MTNMSLIWFLNVLLLCCVKNFAVGNLNYDDILAKMDISEKIGQMVQIDISKFVNSTGLVDYDMLTYWLNTYKIGALLSSPFILGELNDQFGWNVTQWREVLHNVQSIAETTSTKIPILYGIDSMHGASFVRGSALFPQAIAVAATFDRQHAYHSGVITSRDTRASGVPWLSAPVLELGLQPLWARFPETFGEDMYLAAEMGVAAITGMQEVTGDGGFPRQAAACMKHFIAYSDPENGHDRSPVMLPDRSLRQLYLPMFRAAIKAGIYNCRFKL
jgi:beta-glucosidase